MIKRSATLAAGLCIVLAMNPVLADTTGGAASWIYQGPQAGAHCGASLAVLEGTPGGYDDVAFGIPGFNGPGGNGAGRVLIFRGGPAGLSATPFITIDGDKAGAQFGWALDSAGDIDGDGKTDLVVGAPFYTTVSGGVSKLSAGKAFFFRGGAHPSGTLSSAQADWTVTGLQAGEQLGFSVASVKDVGGDGRGEFAVGSNTVTGPVASAATKSKIQVFTQRATAATPELLSSILVQQSFDYGPYMTGNGDFDGDGRGDLVVGLPFRNNPDSSLGGVEIYRGSATGFGTTAEWTIPGIQSDTMFGTGLAYLRRTAPGDRDALAVTAFGAHLPDAPSVGVGAVYVYAGLAPGSPAAAPLFLLYGTPVAPILGAVQGISDLNGDGQPELVVGSLDTSVQVPFEGAVRIFPSAATGGFSSTPLWTARGGSPQIHLGDVVAVGHVDGHPFPDVFVGAPWGVNDQNMNSAGSVRAFCNPTAPPFLQDGTLHQYRLDGHTPVADTHETNQDGFVVSATAVDPNGGAVRIEVQLKAVSAAWTDAPPYHASSLTGSGLPSSVLIQPLEAGSYKWRARAVNEDGPAGPWVHFGGEDDVDLVILPNTPPDAPAPLVINEATGAPIASEATLYDGDAVRVEARVDDPDANTVVLELELREAGDAFTGLPTHRSDLAPSGSTLAIPLSLPIHLPGYLLRVRTTDERGAHSAWVAPASHVEGGFDFKVVSMGSVNVVKGTCLGSAPGAAPAILILAAMAALVRRRS